MKLEDIHIGQIVLFKTRGAWFFEKTYDSHITQMFNKQMPVRVSKIEEEHHDVWIETIDGQWHRVIASSFLKPLSPLEQLAAVAGEDGI